MEERLTLVSPWVNLKKEIEILFARDPEVEIELSIDGDVKVIMLRVNNSDKAEALERILPKEKTYGNVTVNIMVIPANTPDDWSILDTFEKAFKGNDAFTGSKESVTPFGTFQYVMFDPRVVQYPNDDIGDANQIKSTLYQEIAKDVFADTAQDVHFCTSLTSLIYEF